MPSYQLPHAGSLRPELPYANLNPLIKSLVSNPPCVKFQEIVRDGQSTIVARMKVPTPQGHAFILRRLDTGAVSLTTMFRAAFPTADDHLEKDESAWVKANHDLSGSNKAGKARFAGTWVSPALATELAPAYRLQDILPPLITAQPDPNMEYRRSARTQDSPAQQRQLPTPSPSLNAVSPGPTASKRARNEPTRTSPPPSKTSSKKTPKRQAAASSRSSGPASVPPPTPASVYSTPAREPAAATPAGSDETAVEDDEVVEVPGPDMERDVAEQKELIAAFKAQRSAASTATDVDSTMHAPQEGADSGRKRERGEEADANGVQPSFNFKEPEEIASVGERAMASNRRVGRALGIEITPERRSFAWGVGAFALAASAVAFIPNPWF